MDVLTSAASAHEAASETHSSGETSQISSEAQILALKRKLIECDQESRDQRERIAGLEKALEIEKREHQLTTSKLTMLLNKRRASDAQCDQRRADMAGFESSPAWLASMRASAHPPAAETSGAASHAQPRVCVRKAAPENGAARRGGGVQGGVQEMSPGPEKAAVPAEGAKPADAPAESASARAPAEVRVRVRVRGGGGVRVRIRVRIGVRVGVRLSHPNPNPNQAETLAAPSSDSAAESAPPPVSRGASAVTPGCAPPAPGSAGYPPSAAPLPSPPPPSASAIANGGGITSGTPSAYRVPFGYVPGAISVELPKRQRTHKHHAGTAGMPRSYSSLT